MPIVYLQPSDLSAVQAAQVLAFLNAATSAAQLDRDIDFPGEPDIGLRLGQRLLDAGEVSSGSEIAKLENLTSSTVNELLRLTLLDPSLVLDILEGKQPQQANMMWFTRNALPDLWHEQFMSNQAC